MTDKPYNPPAFPIDCKTIISYIPFLRKRGICSVNGVITMPTLSKGGYGFAKSTIDSSKCEYAQKGMGRLCQNMMSLKKYIKHLAGFARRASGILIGYQKRGQKPLLAFSTTEAESTHFFVDLATRDTTILKEILFIKMRTAKKRNARVA